MPNPNPTPNAIPELFYATVCNFTPLFALATSGASAKMETSGWRKFLQFLRERAGKFTPSVPKDKISISPLLVLAIFRTMVVLIGTCRPTPFWQVMNGKGNPAPG